MSDPTGALRARPERPEHPRRPSEPPRFLVWPAILALVLFAGSWLLAAPITLGHLVVSLRRGGVRHLCAAVAISPLIAAPVLCFAFGAFGYVTGTGRLMVHGLPGPGFHNLDRDIRCPNVSLGCVTDGSEALASGANNLALRSLAALLGPMPGGYAGPYPTQGEARRLLDGGRPVDAGATDTAWKRLLVPDNLSYTLRQLAARGAVVRSATVGEAAILLRVKDGDQTVDALFARETGREVAVYLHRERW